MNDAFLTAAVVARVLPAPTLIALGCVIHVLIAALIVHRNFGDGNQLSHFMKNMATRLSVGKRSRRRHTCLSDTYRRFLSRPFR